MTEVALKFQKSILGEPRLPISVACPTYDDRPRLQRLLDSVLEIPAIDEVFVVDHRSTDSTHDFLEQRQAAMSRKGVTLRWKVETRDFSRNFTMADLRNETLRNCRNDVVYLADADHILGPAFSNLARSALKALEKKDVYAVGHDWICVFGDLRLDAKGRVLSHGDCFRHVPVPRFVLKDHATCRQDVEGGRYYYCHPSGAFRTRLVTLPCPDDATIALDDRSANRRALRRTMNNFFQRSVSGNVAGSWLEAYESGALVDDINELDFFHESNRIDADLIGQRFFLPRKF